MANRDTWGVGELLEYEDGLAIHQEPGFLVMRSERRGAGAGADAARVSEQGISSAVRLSNRKWVPHPLSGCQWPSDILTDIHFF